METLTERITVNPIELYGKNYYFNLSHGHIPFRMLEEIRKMIEDKLNATQVTYNAALTCQNY